MYILNSVLLYDEETPTSSQQVGRLQPSSKRIPSLRCQPHLSEQEIEAAYQAFKAKYGSVSLGAIRAELTSNTAFTDVLALDAGPVERLIYIYI